MLATVRSATLLGVDGHRVTVEVHVGNGLPGFTVVGLPDTACREARDRVRAAITTSGLTWPMRRITVNLAPSGLRKTGAGLDLAIAVGVLVASEQLPADAVSSRAFIGEVGLDGTLRPVPGTLALVEVVNRRDVVVPAAAAAEAGLVGGREIRAASRLIEVVDALRGDAPWPDLPPPPPAPPPPPEPDLADVRGHPVAKLALEVAAAGGHHLLMVGPPGAGKTMLARRLAPLLPDLDERDALQVTKVHSASGLALPPDGLVRRPPLRAPHHGTTAVALIGGGTHAMRAGEVSRAHGGVLFLDELGEFKADVLDALRQPLEEGVVRVCRARATASFPARFLLVAAMNPCPCGEGGGPGGCRCGDHARARYARRLSGPLLDRFDLRIHLSRPEPAALLAAEAGEPSATVAERVMAAREAAGRRGLRCNADLPAARLDRHAPLEPGAARLLHQAMVAGTLSARGVHRARRVGRTIADLAGRTDGVVTEVDIALALQLRSEPRALGMAA